MMGRTEISYLDIKNKILHHTLRGWNQTKLTYRKFKATLHCAEL
jgi:hypothetical protein